MCNGLGRWNQVAESKLAPHHDLAKIKSHGLAEERAVKHKRMEFAILATGVGVQRNPVDSCRLGRCDNATGWWM